MFASAGFETTQPAAVSSSSICSRATRSGEGTKPNLYSCGAIYLLSRPWFRQLLDSSRSLAGNGIRAARELSSIFRGQLHYRSQAEVRDEWLKVPIRVQQCKVV